MPVVVALYSICSRVPTLTRKRRVWNFCMVRPVLKNIHLHICSMSKENYQDFIFTSSYPTESHTDYWNVPMENKIKNGNMITYF